jgi:phosphatidylinositol-3-phosphatase
MPAFPVDKRTAAWASWLPATAVLAVAVFLLGLTSCTTATPSALPAATSEPSQAGSPRTSQVRRVDKVLVIVEENRSAHSAAAHMPFLMSQARTYGTATNFYAITHPSLPNYLVVAGGSTFGITDDADPDSHQLNGPSVFGKLISVGRTTKTYAEGMPTNCAQRNHGTYAVRHNPWTYFDNQAERTTCKQFDVPSGSPTAGALSDDVTAGRLPTFGLVIPDLCHDGHDCSAATADHWLRSWLPAIENGPDFRSHRLAIVVTWDEDDDKSGNHVAMVVIQPLLDNKQVTTRLNQYGLSASIARIGGIQPLRDAEKKTDVLAAFDLT